MLVSYELIEELTALAQTAQRAAAWLAQEHQLPPNGNFSRVIANFSSSSQAFQALGWLRKRPLMNVTMGVVSPHIPSVDLLRDAFEVVWQESGMQLGDPLGLFGPDGYGRAGRSGEPIASMEAIRRLAETANFVLAEVDCFRAAFGSDTGQASRTEEPGEQVDITQHMQQVAEAIGDENSARVLAIASRGDVSGEQKMEEILRLDNRFAGKNSSQWGKLLGVKPDAVRGYGLWKRLQEAKKSNR